MLALAHKCELESIRALKFSSCPGFDPRLTPLAVRLADNQNTTDCRSEGKGERRENAGILGQIRHPDGGMNQDRCGHSGTRKLLSSVQKMPRCHTKTGQNDQSEQDKPGHPALWGRLDGA